MVLVVNCQNGYLEKCPSPILRSIVEVADLMDDVWLLTNANPSDGSFHKKIDWKTMSREYEIALYPELAQLGRLRHAMRHPTDFSKELFTALENAKEVFIVGANTEGWIVQLASEVWSNYRIKPTFFFDAWFSVGPKGYHSDANLELSRRFGAPAFQSWEHSKAPHAQRRAATVAEKAAGTTPKASSGSS
jgi:hypothetical protein